MSQSRQGDSVRETARMLYSEFLVGIEAVGKVTRRARRRFGERDWIGMQGDAAERLTIYPRSVARTVASLRGRLEGGASDRALWGAIKVAYLEVIDSRPNDELARTFFNSVSRRLFGTVGVDPDLEFVTREVPELPRDAETAVERVYVPEGGSTAGLLRRVLDDFRPGAAYRDAAADAALAARRLDSELEARTGERHIERLEVARSVFFRNKGAYIIGRVRCGGRHVPVVLPLLNSESGIGVDAMLTTESEVSILFSFTRSCFQVEAGSPRDLIIFLKKIIPRKPIAELYISLGFDKHGKTELYRALHDYLRDSADRFEIARGDRGMVMLVFTLAGYDIVFKIIRDRFAFPKHVTRRQVMERYRLVFERDRVGRLVDAQEFEHLRFRRSRFAPELLEELQREACHTVKVSGDHVVIRHLYSERKLTPLNLYLRQADAQAARSAVIDYGHAIKNLAAANIFPGDFLLKNFGVTRHGRVVFYDYDELCLLTDCRFRRIPAARSVEEEMSAEPWFAVGDNDIFPEEFGRFLGLPDDLRAIFERHHADLLTADFWTGMQQRLQAGEVMDFFPYADRRRLSPEASPAPGDATGA